ncbi:MAG TPA: winged helix-turn-helix domain-containing protein [Zeimonas sp.]|nr:winged helix-turn-helix domain-containing protein [Zeimonas sp.]
MQHDASLHAVRRVVGEWEIDPSLNELRRSDESLRIEPKAMELLVFLADRPGQVIGRGELLEAIWPGVVVGDETLSQAIAKLRKALRDDAREPAYIETIPKRGYRLLAPVRLHAAAPFATASVAVAPADPPAAVSGVPPTPAQASHANPARLAPPAPERWRRSWLAAIVGIAVAAASATAWLANRRAAVDAPALDPASVATGMLAQQIDAPTITVVPFEVLTDAQEHDYLARGIAADLATDLSRLTGLTVVAATAAPAETHEPGAEQAAAAGPRYLVSGTLQRDGEQLRLNVRLSDAGSRRQLWSHRYVAPAGDPLSVQKGIVASLLDVLPAKVGDAARDQVARRYTRNPAAYDHFLRGQAVVAARRHEENEQARAMYRKALELDPTFARAYAMLAVTYTLDYRYRWGSDVANPLVRARELAETAREINGDTPEAWWSLGFVGAHERRHDDALRHFERAIALNRHYAEAWSYMGAIHVFTGDASRALPLLRAALRVHAEGRAFFFELLARAHLFLGDNELALINLREAIARNPTVLEARVFLAATLAAAGDLDAARWEADEVRQLFPDFDKRKWFETFPMTDPAYRNRLESLLAEAGL